MTLRSSFFSCAGAPLLLCLAATMASAAGDKVYSNARFQYEVTYPGGLLTAKGEADNGDGQTFTSADGKAVMRVFGRNNAGGETLDARYDAVQKDAHGGIVHRRITPPYFVVAARKGDLLTYEKTFLVGDAFKTLEFEYPAAQRSTWDPVAAAASKSFRSLR